jgi:putative membrane protein insertion efficiency factor
MTSPSRPARALRSIVRGYQHVRAGRPSSCRHVPSCSSYAIEALETHGAARGSWLALCRLGRCRPGGTWGFDPVPAASDSTPPMHTRLAAPCSADPAGGPA